MAAVFPRFGHEFIRLRPRHLRAHERHGVLIFQRSYHQHKYEHSHSANPVGQTPPEIDSHGRLSISRRIVEPVVVKPDTVSKNASI